MKVPKPKKMTSGNWYIYLRLGDTGIGITEPTRSACIRSAQLVKAEHRAGKLTAPPPPDPTLSSVLDAYISSRSNVLSPSTIRGYRMIQKSRFLDAQKMQLSQINWQETVNAEAALCSPKTLKNAWGLLSSAVLEATEHRPRVTLPQVVRHERPWLTPDQINTFTAAVHGDPVEIPALLGLCSLRCSEILGLRWSSIDLKAGTIRVHGAMVRDESGVFVYKEANKNRSSDRIVPILMPQLLTALQAAPPHKPEDPVVTYTARGLLARINTVCRRSGLPEVGVHGLRHSFASLAYHLGLPYKTTMQIAGWEDDATMRRIYTHIASQDIADAAELLKKFYQPES